MSIFGPKRVTCPPNEWTTLLDQAFVQMPRNYEVSFSSTDGETPSGLVEEKKTSWIFPNPPKTSPLLPEMRFSRGWFNTFYRLRVKPDREVVATID